MRSELKRWFLRALHSAPVNMGVSPGMEPDKTKYLTEEQRYKHDKVLTCLQWQYRISLRGQNYKIDKERLILVICLQWRMQEFFKAGVMMARVEICFKF